MTKSVTATVGQNAGDNYIVTATPDNDTAVRETEILTVWRRLWVELDQMAAPQEGVTDGFLSTEKFTGLRDANGIAIGKWSAQRIENEPVDFDVLEQPPKPDISLLTTAMVAACVTVRKVPQEADGTEDPDWIVWDSATTNPGQWDNTAPFVHNLANFGSDLITATGTPSRDVNVNDDFFWCMQGVGAYESIVSDDGDQADEEYYYGGAPADGSTVFLIFNEAIRDAVMHGNGFSIKRTENEFHRLVAFHEVLHFFGFTDSGERGYSAIADGPIMDDGWMTADTLSADVTTLSPAQIEKIQRCDIPGHERSIS